jgi:hypothetical protein
MPSFLGQWLPFLAMSAGSAYLFWRAAFRVQRTWMLYDLLAWLEDAIRRRLSSGRAVRPEAP